MTKVHRNTKNHQADMSSSQFQIQQFPENSNNYISSHQTFSMDNSHASTTDTIISGSYYINPSTTYSQQMYQQIHNFPTNNNINRNGVIHNSTLLEIDTATSLPSTISDKSDNQPSKKSAASSNSDSNISRNMKQEPSLTATPIPSGSSSCDGSSGRGDCISPIGSLSDLANPALAAVEQEMSDGALNDLLNVDIFGDISIHENLQQFEDIGMVYADLNESSKANVIPTSPEPSVSLNDSAKSQKSNCGANEEAANSNHSKQRHKHRSKQKRREKLKINTQSSQIPKATADPTCSLTPQTPSCQKKVSSQIKTRKSTSKERSENKAPSKSRKNAGLPPVGVKRWQTVTAVQAPKMPPLLSDQDRIPKRGRPSKQMTELNLKLKASQAAAAEAQKASVAGPSSDLVSTYTITDSGAIKKLALKHKENKRNKERAEAFRNMLSEISKKSSIQSKTASARNVVGMFNKPGVCTRGQASKNLKDSSKSKSSGRRSKVSKKPRIVSEDDVYNFTELAKKFNISNSILFRHLENSNKMTSQQLQNGKKQKNKKNLDENSTNKESVEKVVSVSRPSVRGSITLHDKALHGSGIKLKLPNAAESEAPGSSKSKMNQKMCVVEDKPVEDALVEVSASSKSLLSSDVEKSMKKKVKKSKKKKKKKLKHYKGEKEKKNKDKKKKSKRKSFDFGSPSSDQHLSIYSDNKSANDNHEVSIYSSESSFASNMSPDLPEDSDKAALCNFENANEDETDKDVNPSTKSSPPVFGSNLANLGVVPTFRGIQEHGGIANLSKGPSNIDFNLPSNWNFNGNTSSERFANEQGLLKKHKYKRKKILRRSRNAIDPEFLGQMDKLSGQLNECHIENCKPASINSSFTLFTSQVVDEDENLEINHLNDFPSLSVFCYQPFFQVYRSVKIHQTEQTSSKTELKSRSQSVPSNIELEEDTVESDEEIEDKEPATESQVDIHLLNHIKAVFAKTLSDNASVPTEVGNQTFDNAVQTYLDSFSNKSNRENSSADDLSETPCKKIRYKGKKNNLMNKLAEKLSTKPSSAVVTMTSMAISKPSLASEPSCTKRGPGRPRKRPYKESLNQSVVSLTSSEPTEVFSLHSNQQMFVKSGKKQSLESVVNKLKNKEGLKEVDGGDLGVKTCSQKAPLVKARKTSSKRNNICEITTSSSASRQNSIEELSFWSTLNFGNSICFLNPPTSLPKKKNFLTSAIMSSKEISNSILPPPVYPLDVLSLQSDFQLPYDLWWLFYNKKLSSVNQSVVKRYQETRTNVSYEACYCSTFPCTCPYIPEKTSQEDTPNSHRNNLSEKIKSAAIKRFKTYEKGWGLQTRQSLHKGQFVVEYLGEVLPIKRFISRVAEKYITAACGKSYCAHISQEFVIDQHVIANASRHINHSCEPNCELERRAIGRENRLCVIAKQDMTSGVELTIDYNRYMCDYGQTESCRCGSSKCRKIFGGVKLRDYNKNLNESNQQEHNCEESVNDEMSKQSPSLTSDDRESIKKGNILLIRNLLKATSASSPTDKMLYRKKRKPTSPASASLENITNEVIRCICGIDKEEGVMIQCGRCDVWQHCQCMKIEPEHYAVAIYLCEICSGGKRNTKRNNRKFSRQSTNQRLGEVEMVPQPPNAPPGHKYFVSLLKEGLCVKQGYCVRVLHDHRLRRDSLGTYNPPTRSSSRIQSYNSNTSERIDFMVVEKLWTDESGDKFAFGFHLLRPQDTIHEDDELFFHNELFASPFHEIVPLEAVLSRCYVITPLQYRKSKPKGGKLEEIFVCEKRLDSSLRVTSQTYIPPASEQLMKYRKPISLVRDQKVPDHFRRNVINRVQWLKQMEHRVEEVASPNIFQVSSDNLTKTKRLSGIVNKLKEKASAK